MSIYGAMLSPNLSDKDLVELIKVETEGKLRVIEAFQASFDKLETKEQKARYITNILPIVIAFTFS